MFISATQSSCFCVSWMLNESLKDFWPFDSPDLNIWSRTSIFGKKGFWSDEVIENCTYCIKVTIFFSNKDPTKFSIKIKLSMSLDSLNLLHVALPLQDVSDNSLMFYHLWITRNSWERYWNIGMSFFFLGSGTCFVVFKIWQLFKTRQPDLAYNWRDEMASLRF